MVNGVMSKMKIEKIIIDNQIIHYIKEIAFFNCSNIYCTECPIKSICNIKLLIKKYLKLNFLEVN